MSKPHVSVCICTYRRVVWLERLIRALQQQETGARFTYSIVVADNDLEESARETVEGLGASSRIPVTYCVEPEKNIALVRNRAIEAATGDWIAFLDDDEFPVEDWLLQMFRTATSLEVAGVLGPVRPHFEEGAPDWAKKCGLYDRPEHETGFVMSWPETRTGNVLFRRGILPVGSPPFAEEFGTGGEDQDFFRRMMADGHRFVWCNEGVVFESVPPARWNKRIMMQRALLRGRNTLKHSGRSLPGLLKSSLAAVLYILALPVLALLGMHLFMRYLIKLCDHLGKLAAAVGINPVHERVG